MDAPERIWYNGDMRHSRELRWEPPTCDLHPVHEYVRANLIDGLKEDNARLSVSVAFSAHRRDQVAAALATAEALILEQNAQIHKAIADRVTWQTRWEATDKALGEALARAEAAEVKISRVWAIANVLSWAKKTRGISEQLFAALA